MKSLLISISGNVSESRNQVVFEERKETLRDDEFGMNGGRAFKRETVSRSFVRLNRAQAIFVIVKLIEFFKIDKQDVFPSNVVQVPENFNKEK